MRRIFGILAFCSLLSVSCARNSVKPGAGDQDAVLLKLGPVYLTKAEMEARILEMGPEYVPYLRTGQGRKTLLEAVLKQKILVRAALDRGLGDRQDIKDEIVRLKKEQERALRLYRESLLADRLIEDLREREIQISDDEIAAYYNDHRHLYAVRQILVADKKKAEDLFEGLRGKNPAQAQVEFGRLAALHSLDSRSAKAGGKIPPFLEGELDESFARATAALKPGQVSPPVETKVGYHLIHLENTAPVSFNDEYKERARRILERKKMDVLMELWKDKYVVEVRDESLKPYLGL
ncbi:MAG: peptidylprolyl isomerase [Elusimicrobia bacterium]|nr:peptidylprolyl isomerase [Elusimicrobiota bacterium]